MSGSRISIESVMGKPGNVVTISGRGFGSTKGTVYFGTTAVTGAAITSWEDTQIKVTIPAVAAGNYAVKVAANGVNSNAYNNFTILTASSARLVMYLLWRRSGT